MIQVVEQKQRKINDLEQHDRHKFVALDKTIKQIQLKAKQTHYSLIKEARVKDEAVQNLQMLR
jgi:hypothetical protein